MRIVLDLQGAQTRSRFRGIGRYSLSFAKALLKNAGNHDFWIVLNDHFPESISEVVTQFEGLIPKNQIRTFHLPRSFMPAYLNPQWRIHAAEYVRETFLANLKPDFIHVSSLMEGWIDNAVTSVRAIEHAIPTAITFYDLIPLLKKEKYLTMPGLKKWYLKKLASLQQSSLLFAISEHVRQEAIDIINIAPAKIITIPAAVSDIFRVIELELPDINDLKSRYKIRRPFILYNGGTESRKNADNLLRAFALLPTAIQARYDLVLVGKSLEHDKARLEKFASHNNISKHLIITEYIPDDDLVKLYNQCELFVFPSFLEGFGLPPLEAMSCGAPTIASNTSSLPEVIGLSEALFDPTSPQSIADKMFSALTDNHFRDRLCQHAQNQAKKFSWDDSAKKAIGAFEQFHTLNQTNRVDKSVDQHYQSLINKIINLPHEHHAPVDSDYMMIAQAVARNQDYLDQ